MRFFRPDVYKKRAASIFKVTEIRSGECWSV